MNNNLTSVKVSRRQSQNSTVFKTTDPELLSMSPIEHQEFNRELIRASIIIVDVSYKQKTAVEKLALKRIKSSAVHNSRRTRLWNLDKAIGL